MSKASQIRQKAQSLLKKGQFDKAIDEYKRLVSIESRNPNLYNELGDIYIKAGNRVAAVSSFVKASKNYENVALYNNAVAVCKKILRIVPQHLETLFKLGELRIKQHLEGEGIVYFNQFLDVLLGNPDCEVGELPDKLEIVLKLTTRDEDILSKTASVYERLDLKIKAVSALSMLCGCLGESGDTEAFNACRARIEMLCTSLTSEEQKEVEEILSKVGGAELEMSKASEGSGSPDSGESPIPAAAAETVVEEAAPAQETAAAVETEGAAGGVEVPPYSETAIPPEAQSSQEPVAEGAGEVAVETLEEPKAPAGAERRDETESPAAAAGAGEAGEAAAAAETAGSGRPAQEGAPSATGRRAAGDSITDKLADEITSDVEKDDHQGHYDLGMAYLEMALYTEAIKELQVAARSEQLQLKSYEMIGNCFLLQNNPRLAVKQLLRGLEVSTQTGGESLGIHYNLGLAYEILGEDEKAREHFEEVYVVDITFRDIAEKMEKYSSLP